MTTTQTPIDTLVDQAKTTIPADAWQRLDTARHAIAANPLLGIRDLLNILTPAPVAPEPTAAQADRLRRAQTEAAAAGTTLTHRITDTGLLLLSDTDQDGTVTAVVDRDGNLTL